MKTAISMPDRLFQRAEKLARRLGVSRSRPYCLAVEQLLSRYADQEVTQALDRVYGEHPGALDQPIEDMQSDLFNRSAISTVVCAVKSSLTERVGSPPSARLRQLESAVRLVLDLALAAPPGSPRVNQFATSPSR